MGAESPGRVTVIEETPRGKADGVNTSFLLSRLPMLILRVNSNGLLAAEGRDFTLDGDTLNFINPPEAGDRVSVTYAPYGPYTSILARRLSSMGIPDDRIVSIVKQMKEAGVKVE